MIPKGHGKRTVSLFYAMYYKVNKPTIQPTSDAPFSKRKNQSKLSKP